MENLYGQIVWQTGWTILRKIGWKSVQCTLFSVLFTVYITVLYTVQYCTVQYIKVVLLSLLREPKCFSVWGVEPLARLIFCLTPPEEMIPIVRQGGSNCPTNLILSDNLHHFLAKIQGGPNSPTRWLKFSEWPKYVK